MRLVRASLLLGLILFGVIPAEESYGKGLKVSPSNYKWRNAKVGARMKCPAAILIKNESTVIRSYTLRAIKPSELKAKTTEGFTELPSRQWISFDRKRVSIGPEEWKQVEIFIEIPQKEEHLAQKWDFFVEVKEYAAGGEVFVLACYARFYVLTENKAEQVTKKR
ncbi:MAG: hypothetical protein AB1567_01000 [bacterium]